METLYSILGVSRSADDAALKNGYYKKASSQHPDRGGDHEQMALINRAYMVLSDPILRRKYDNELEMLAEICPTCSASGVIMKRTGKGFAAPRVPHICEDCNGSGFLRWRNKPPKETVINLSGTPGKRNKR